MFNQRGHTLVELMIASGLIVLAMMAMATMITSQRSAYIHAQQTVEAGSVMRQIQDFLSSPEDCSRIFRTMNPTSDIRMSVLRDTNGDPVFWENGVPGMQPALFGNVIYLTEMWLKPSPIPIGNNSNGMVVFETHFAGASSSGQHGPLKPRRTYLYVETDSFGRIEACSSKTTQAYSCRTVTIDRPSATRISVACTSPFEQMISCGMEDRNIAESNPNALIPRLPGGTAFAMPISIPPTDDAHVNSLAPTANYGGSPSINIGTSTAVEEAFFKFDVPSDVTGTIVSAFFRVYVTDASATAPRLYSAANNWNEGTINWNTKPSIGGAFAPLGSAPAGNFIDYNISGYIAGPFPRTYSLALRSASSDITTVESKEPQNMMPHLLLNVLPPAQAGGRCDCYDAESSRLICHALCCRL